MRARFEAGFTLIEVIVVTAIVALVAGTAGALFLAGASPAVAAASRDVSAAFDEARRTAIAFDAATVVFTPAGSGTGYRARVYERFPGDPSFGARNGPGYDSTVTISETASPLGAPGFAFTIDARGAVVGLANYVLGSTTYTNRPCPATGSFVLHLVYERDVRSVSIPCELAPSGTLPVAFETPPPAQTPAPLAAPTCPTSSGCTLAVITPAPGGGTCPPGTIPDAASPGVCDPLAGPSAAPSGALPPAPAPTCPSGMAGTVPNCSPLAAPTPTGAAACVPGAPDPMGFATCLESNPIRSLGPTITHSGCGTHTPVADPGPSFTVAVEVWLNGSPWGTYAVRLVTRKAPWLDQQGLPPAQTCGLAYTLAFAIDAIVAVSGNAHLTPALDTGDASLSDAGVGAIVNDPPASVWGSDS